MWIRRRIKENQATLKIVREILSVKPNLCSVFCSLLFTYHYPSLGPPFSAHCLSLAATCQPNTYTSGDADGHERLLWRETSWGFAWHLCTAELLPAERITPHEISRESLLWSSDLLLLMTSSCGLGTSFQQKVWHGNRWNVQASQPSKPRLVNGTCPHTHSHAPTLHLPTHFVLQGVCTGTHVLQEELLICNEGRKAGDQACSLWNQRIPSQKIDPGG